MPLTFYSMSVDAMVIRDMIEDPTLDVPMKITSTGILYVKGMFIEATRSYIVIPPIPPPSGSITYDDFESYVNLTALNGLNSGSNEWDNITPLAAYVAAEAYVGIKAGDDFESYADGTVVTASNMLLGGTGWWSDVYAASGIDSVWGYFYDSLGYYETGSVLNNSGSYIGASTNKRWNGNWISRRLETGVISFDDFSLYITGSLLSGSGYTPRPDWPWNGNWDTKNMT